MPYIIIEPQYFRASSYLVEENGCECGKYFFYSQCSHLYMIYDYKCGFTRTNRGRNTAKCPNNADREVDMTEVVIVAGWHDRNCNSSIVYI